MENSLMTFLLLFNDQKFGKSSLFCCNGYRHAILELFFMNLKRIVHELKFFRFLKIPSYKSNLL